MVFTQKQQRWLEAPLPALQYILHPWGGGLNIAADILLPQYTQVGQMDAQTMRAEGCMYTPKYVKQIQDHKINNK